MNEYKIKFGLILNDTQPITGITNNSGLTDSVYELATSDAIKNYIDSNIIVGQIDQVLYKTGTTLSGSSILSFDGDNLIMGGNLSLTNGGISDIGGYYINLINKTGTPTIKGKVVTYDSTTPFGFKYYPSGNTDISIIPYIGIIMESGILNNEYCPIVVSGVVDVLICSNSDPVNIGDALSTDISTNIGDIGKNTSFDTLIARALENGVAGNIIKCLIFPNDLQQPYQPA